MSAASQPRAVGCARDGQRGRAPLPCEARLRAGAEDHRRRVPRARVAQPASADAELGADQRGHVADVVPVRVGVERVEQRPRTQARRGERAHGAAQLAHRRRGADPAADHVSDDEADRLALVEPEGVVPVAPDLEAAHGRAIGDRDLEPRRGGQAARQQAPAQLLGRLLLLAARPHQLLLVAAPVRRVEHGRADALRVPLVVAVEHRVDQRRQPRAVRAHDLHRDLADRALHPQQRRVVGLVVDPAAGGEQVLEAPRAHERLPAQPRPRLEGPVDPHDRPVRERREVAAGGVLEEVLGAVLAQLVAARHAARNDFIAATVSSGALRFGQ